MDEAKQSDPLPPPYLAELQAISKYLAGKDFVTLLQKAMRVNSSFQSKREWARVIFENKATGAYAQSPTRVPLADFDTRTSQLRMKRLKREQHRLRKILVKGRKRRGNTWLYFPEGEPARTIVTIDRLINGMVKELARKLGIRIQKRTGRHITPLLQAQKDINSDYDDDDGRENEIIRLLNTDKGRRTLIKAWVDWRVLLDLPDDVIPPPAGFFSIEEIRKTIQRND